MAKVTRKEVDTLAIFKAEMAKKSKVDDGAKGKSAEVALKNFINPNSKIKGYVTPQAKDFDIFVMENGKRANIEIKTACGELANLDNLDSSIQTMLQSVYPKSTYIIYCPEIDDNIPLEKQFFVFTRDEFITLCETYDGKGQILRTKTATNSRGGKGIYRLSFQSFYSKTRPTMSKKLADHIWNCCYNQPTVEEWVKEREG
jgi:hypothetical protein